MAVETSCRDSHHDLGDNQRAPVIATVRPAATKDVAPNLAVPWVLRLRYGIVAGQTTIILSMAYIFNLKFPLLWTLAPLFAILGSNIALGRSYHVFAPFPEKTLGAVFTLDTLCLTAILGLTGGPMNPFSLLYLVQITLSAVVLNKLWTWALGILSTACFGLLFWLHVPLPILEAHHREQGLSPHLIGMWIAFMIAAALITFFTGKVSDALRRREQEVLALRDQVANHERLASLGTLAAGAAHELGTPLGTIAVVARELERYASGVSAKNAILDDARLIRSEVERCRLILERMSVQSAEPMGETPCEIAISALLDGVRDQFSIPQRNQISILAYPDISVVVPQRATVQSLAALVQNGLDASVDDRLVNVSVTRSGGHIRISIEDQGCGMPASVLRRVSEPFFTTKEPGRGMGLGTFLVRTFAERLGGRVSFNSIEGRGTTVTLELPVNATAEKNGYVAV